MEKNELRILNPKTKEELATVRDLEEFINVISRDRMDISFYRFLRAHIQKGLFDDWFLSIGETEFADMLRPFQRSSMGTYQQAAEIFYRNLKEPKTDFSSVVGYDYIKKEIFERCIYPDKFRKISEKYGKMSGGGMILYGPPGCGKSYLSNAVAGESKKIFVKKGVSDFFESGGVEGIFTMLRKIGNSMLFIDEMELLGINREYEGVSSRLIINEMLAQMDGRLKDHGTFVMGATNTPWIMDPALLRTGRFNELLYVGVPDDMERVALFDFYSNGLPLDGMDTEALAKGTEFYSCSDIQNLCAEAAAIPWREAIATGKERDINQEDFDQALEDNRSTAVEWFESARNVVFSRSARSKFQPMIKEIERFHKKTGE